MDYQDFDLGITTNGISIDSAFEELTLSFQILIEEIEPVVAEKSQFE